MESIYLKVNYLKEVFKMEKEEDGEESLLKTNFKYNIL